MSGVGPATAGPNTGPGLETPATGLRHDYPDCAGAFCFYTTDVSFRSWPIEVWVKRREGYAGPHFLTVE